MTHFNDYKTAQDRLEQAGTNDWYTIPLIILIGIIAVFAFWVVPLLSFIGIENLFNVMAQFITSI